MTDQYTGDGGPAYPWGEHGTRLGGATMRDFFAVQAMLRSHKVAQ